MLAIRRTALTGRSLCSRRQHWVARPVSAAGWPDLRALITPVTSAVSPVVRREGPYFVTSSSPGAVAAAASGSGNASATSADASQQQQQQPPVRFRLRRISGDGACMFRAIVQGAQVATHGKAMSLESEEVAAQNLRQAVVRELRKRREEMEPFLPGIASDFDEYCRMMSHPMAWGGEPEMVMAVHVVQRPITVYHVQDGELAPIVTYGDHMLGAVQPINLLWSGSHYDLLVPEGPEAGAGGAPAA
ncbi:hypothetical protein PLESTB_001560400 [Pleodorina starrii]|uniref:Ubiquitin thioesterase OTU n=1 Tax=Pleodorina starrii TaxID=330485 RepID=A0A9W6BY91_9CHLO|nr:hypothetical protein PLESTM_001476600 [Pleodorina starrii]GLC59980.1 hypothetical protein PLESTB_001560400 [Pleodorina starrii]GLC72792.1 hypothetical protein PLESTF_001293600 [Pleodorina starrii]